MNNSKIATHQYNFFQHFGEQPGYIKNTIDVLKTLPIPYHEMASVALINEQSGLIEKDAINELEQWGKAFSAINKKVISYYFNLPAVQIEWTEELWLQLEKLLGNIKNIFPDVEIITTNPLPLDWGNPNLAKTDEQLEKQLDVTRHVATLVKKNGLKFAYHFHDAELKHNTRELTFMMDNIPADDMALILDTNWCVMAGYPPLEIAKKYESRIALLHIRSSHEKIWDEILQEGEENNKSFLKYMLDKDFNGPIVIELVDTYNVRYPLPLAERWEKSYRQMKAWLSEIQ